MNKGVEILLERMNSNPDEFEGNSLVASKWRDITEKVYQRVAVIHGEAGTDDYWKHQLDFLSDEEVLAIHNKLVSIRADEFTRDVMGRLLADADDGNYHSSITPKSTRAEIMKNVLEPQLNKIFKDEYEKYTQQNHLKVHEALAKNLVKK